MSSAMPWVSWAPCVPLANNPQNVPMMELTAWPPSAGRASTRATLRPRRAASSAAETPAMPAPSTQISADTRTGAAPAGRRTMRVAFGILAWSESIGGQVAVTRPTIQEFLAELRSALVGAGVAAEDDRDLDIAAPLENFDRDVVGVAAHLEVDARVLEVQVAQHHFVQERRQARIVQPDFVRGGIELQAERGLDQREGRGAGPGLRRAGDGVERRAAAAAALEATEQFRQPAHLHVSGGVEQAFEHPLDRSLEAVAREPERDQRVVVRPDRSVVIRHRIVARFGIGNGADAPAGKEIRPQQSVADLERPLRPGDAGEQHLSGIGAAHATGLLLAVERERVGAEVRTPERGVESLGQEIGLGLEPVRILHAAKPLGTTRRQELGAVDVALHLRQRDRAFRQMSVGVEDRVLRILPALVGEALLSGAVIFDEAVVVGVAGAIDPGERGLDGGP